MSIPIATSKQDADWAGGESALAALASAFFRRLPGAPDSPPEAATAPSALRPAVGESSPGVSAIGLPASSSSSAPDVLVLPSTGDRTVQSVKPIQPALPGDSVRVPYYFLADSGVGKGAPVLAQAAHDDRVVAQAFGMPGEGALNALVSEILLEIGSPVRGDREPGRVGGYYFLDDPVLREQAHAHAASESFDINAIRRDFPILSERVNGKPLVWFDNAATTQKPRSVIERLSEFYLHENSNIHRAAHELAARATDAYEDARDKVARFIGAGSSQEIVFVRGATEAINLVAQTWGLQNLGQGDEIVVSLLEHHANIVPWQQVAARTGAKIRVIPVDDSGQLDLEAFHRLLNERTKFVSITQVSNALGTVTPVAQVIQAAHAVGAKVLVDGAQSVSHMPVNVQALDADFFAFSGHKVFGPTGIGVLYGRQELLQSMPPWQGGGNMIADVTFERTQFQAPPNKFEAGTGNIADAVGLGAAIDYVQKLGLVNVARYEHGLVSYATQRLSAISGVRLIGTAADKASVVSFVLDGYSPEEVGKALNQEGIAVRSGHHCAQPILRRFGVEATVRPSFAFYNTCTEIDRLVSVVATLTHDKTHLRR